MICTLSLLLFVHITISLEEKYYANNNNNTIGGHTFHENILCRGCGNEITSSSSLISKISPSSQFSFHDTIFRKDAVLVQVLLSDFFLPNYLITANQSNCVGISEWEEADSWFPGYRWKSCVCPDCGILVGWVFEPMNSTLVDQSEAIFGLILESLIGESFINSLTIHPEV